MVAGEMPDFSIPEAEQEFIGDPDDKKDQANHRKRLAQLEVQQQDKKVPGLHCMCCPACVHVLQACSAFMHVLQACSAFMHALQVCSAFMHVLQACSAFMHVLHACAVLLP
jgi:hypothetical protein